MREINVSSAGDPVHAGDKALTRETPVKRGLTGMRVVSVLDRHVFGSSRFLGTRDSSAVRRHYYFLLEHTCFTPLSTVFQLYRGDIYMHINRLLLWHHKAMLYSILL